MKLLKLLSLLVLFAFTASAQNVGIGTPTPSDQLHTTGTVRFEKYRSVGTRMVQIDSSGRLVVAPAGPLFAISIAQAIPDNGCSGGNGITGQINVINQPYAVSSSKIAVRINITHTWAADLRIYLYPPGGGVLVLAAENGGAGDNFTNTIFTDQAPVSINTGIAPFTGQYKPKGGATECFQAGTPLANFGAIGSGNIVPNGTWTLRVLDNGLNDIGILNSWSVSFTGPESYLTADESEYIPKFSAGNLVPSNIYQQPSGINSGNIGIGTTNPTVKLEINGAIKIGGTSTSSKGSIKYSPADSSFEVYDNTRWKSLINNVDVLGENVYGEAPGFYSMFRNVYVELPSLQYTVKKSGVYLVLLASTGYGQGEYHNVYDFNDSRKDLEGEIRVTDGTPNAPLFKKIFFYSSDLGAGEYGVYYTDDSEKSYIGYLTVGQVIKVYAFVSQYIGSAAPPQEKAWGARTQIKYILMN